MQSLHQNALLLLMLVVTGVSVYVAMEMRKRLNRADALIHSIESVTKNVVTKQDVDALKALVAPARSEQQDAAPPAEPPATAEPAIKIVQSRPKKRKADDA